MAFNKIIWFILIILCTSVKLSFAQQINDYPTAYWFGEKSNKYVFVFFEADWCHWCHKMKDETLNNFTKFKKQYVISYLDINRNNNQYWFTRFKQIIHVPWGGLPSYVLIDPINNKIIRTGQGYKSKSDFLKWLLGN